MKDRLTSDHTMVFFSQLNSSHQPSLKGPIQFFPWMEHTTKMEENNMAPHGVSVPFHFKTQFE